MKTIDIKSFLIGFFIATTLLLVLGGLGVIGPPEVQHGEPGGVGSGDEIIEIRVHNPSGHGTHDGTTEFIKVSDIYDWVKQDGRWIGKTVDRSLYYHPASA